MLNLPTSVFEYLAKTPEERCKLFLATNTLSNKPADYYIDFQKTTSNVTPHIQALNQLSQELHPTSITAVKNYFSTHPELLTLVPTLLAIRAGKTMDVQEQDSANDYQLDFANPQRTIPEHLEFLDESGLANFLVNHPVKSYLDLAQGIEIGLNSNARKNRGGHLGEAFLENALSKFATQVKPIKKGSTNTYTPLPDNVTFVDQGTIKVMQEAFDINLEDSGIPTNRRFDGAVYQRSENHLTLLEINFFNAGGSKLKSVAGEFTNLQRILRKAGSRFIYVTSGDGWTNDISHIQSAITNIPNLFNYTMVKNGYIQQLLESDKSK